MIDTVVVGFRVSPQPWQLRSWISHPLIPPDGKVHGKYFLRSSLDNGAPLEFTYYPSSEKYPEPMFRVQVSLPKAVYANNVEMIMTEEEIGTAIQQVNAYIAGQKWLPDVDLGQGVLSRIDASYNHPVGERLPDYLSALSKLTYPGRKTSLYQNEGIQYRSTAAKPSVCTTFYDKGRESHNPIAHGMLRQESSLRRTDYIEKRLGLDKPTLNDVRIPWLQGVLQRDLEMLGLTGRVLCDRSLALEMLVTEHGVNRAMQLFGYLAAKDSLSVEQMASWKPKHRTMQRWEKQIAEAGVAPAMTHDEVELEPLSIDVWTAKNDGHL